ncbi:MAG: enolase C-terminal domain-like protein [Chloroflexota bacterium]
MSKIASVRCFEVTGPIQPNPPEERQVGMLDIYPEMAARPPARNTATSLSETFVEVATDDGATGLFGPIFHETAPIIKHKLAAHVVGQDPLAYERIWDVMYRSDRHSRKGYEMMAISAVDNALWDLRGKMAGVPVYRLLGGPTRDRIDCYASMLGHSLEPDLVTQRAKEMVARGFKAEKWFFRYGPASGLEGLEKNVELVRLVREAVGPHIEIMFDCWMGWDLTYAIRMLERIEQYHPRWVEEMVPADRINDFALIRRTSRVPVATGEHEYTRWGFLQLLQADAIDVIQADPDWCGGITELVKICTLTSTYGRPVVPHGHSVYAAANVIASQPPGTCPMAEFLLRSQPRAQHFIKNKINPENGSIPLPPWPGLGIDLDQSVIEKTTDL